MIIIMMMNSGDTLYLHMFCLEILINMFMPTRMKAQRICIMLEYIPFFIQSILFDMPDGA